MISLIVVLAIVASIALGYKTKINTGLFAIVFAYLIGCFILNLKSGQVVAMWPISIFFVIFSVSLFYAFAMANGTLEKLSTHLLYSCRKFPQMLPFAIFLAAALIAGLGAGFFTVMALMAPITMMLCEKTGMSKLLGAVAVNYGALGGANFMTSQSGIIFRSLMESAGYGETAFAYSTAIFVTTMVIPVVVIAGMMAFSNSKIIAENFAKAKPEPFDRNQTTTLYLIVLMMVIVLAAPVLHLLLPANKTITFFNSKMDIGLIAIILSVVALILRLADEKTVVSKVPWNLLIMICGVGMLISVAIKAGTIKLLAGWIGANMASFLVPVAMCLVAGAMSFFSSTLGVVTPALFPTIPSISASTGIDPMLLFVSVVIGAQATAISPFSSGGSLALGGCAKEEDRAGLFPRLMFWAVPVCLIASTIASIILFYAL